MSEPFEAIRQRLLVAGIAPRHARRYIGELRDHVVDLKAAGASDAEALERLGTVDELARVMTERPEFRSWTARAPWLTLVLVPPIGLAAVVVASIFLMIGISKLFPWLAYPMWTAPAWVQTSVTAFTIFEIRVVPIFIGWGIGVVAYSRRIPVSWPIFGMMVIAFLAGASDFTVTPGPPGHGAISFGLGFAFPDLDRDFVRNLINNQIDMRILMNLVLTAGPYLAARGWLRRAAAWG